MCEDITDPLVCAVYSMGRWDPPCFYTMSEIAEHPGDGLARPYTVGTFQTRLDKFESFIKDITFQDVEATPEERRQWITGKHAGRNWLKLIFFCLLNMFIESVLLKKSRILYQ